MSMHCLLIGGPADGRRMVIQHGRSISVPVMPPLETSSSRVKDQSENIQVHEYIIIPTDNKAMFFALHSDYSQNDLPRLLFEGYRDAPSR